MSRVIVGSVDENGDADPYTLCFVFVDEKRATCRYNIPSKNTNHVETVCLLSKHNAKQHIEVGLNLDELDLTNAE